MKQILKREFSFEWTFKDYQLIARSSESETWKINLTEPSVSNSSGCLIEQYQDLGVSTAIKRLFQAIVIA
ncbi:MAG: hypothetical protein HWD61_06235 [Parachlamydiaceae bacterium]|nr:MAG: hypothetical protein HWD61_06235 [Parachlamydiaceae bacterium]